MFIHIYTSLYIYVCLCPSLSIYIQYVHLSSFANDFPSCKFLHAFPIDDGNFPNGFPFIARLDYQHITAEPAASFQLFDVSHFSAGLGGPPWQWQRCGTSGWTSGYGS